MSETEILAEQRKKKDEENEASLKVIREKYVPLLAEDQKNKY